MWSSLQKMISYHKIIVKNSCKGIHGSGAVFTREAIVYLMQAIVKLSVKRKGHFRSIG
jgi:hypothetical protein